MGSQQASEANARDGERVEMGAGGEAELKAPEGGKLKAHHPRSRAPEEAVCVPHWRRLRRRRRRRISRRRRGHAQLRVGVRVEALLAPAAVVVDAGRNVGPARMRTCVCHVRVSVGRDVRYGIRRFHETWDSSDGAGLWGGSERAMQLTHTNLSTPRHPQSYMWAGRSGGTLEGRTCWRCTRRDTDTVARPAPSRAPAAAATAAGALGREAATSRKKGLPPACSRPRSPRYM